MGETKSLSPPTSMSESADTERSEDVSVKMDVDTEASDSRLADTSQDIMTVYTFNLIK